MINDVCVTICDTQKEHTQNMHNMELFVFAVAIDIDLRE